MAPSEDDKTLDERWQAAADLLGSGLKRLKPSTLPKEGREEAEKIIRHTRLLMRIEAADLHQREQEQKAAEEEKQE